MSTIGRAEMGAPVMNRTAGDAASGMVMHAIMHDQETLRAIRLIFDRSLYLLRHPDVAASGIDPLDHFLTSGASEGRSPSALFDTGFYLAQTPDPAARDAPFLHYLRSGVAAGLDPHPLIQTRFYREQEPALASDVDPLEHMLGAGRRQDRKPNPLFDPGYYRRRCVQAEWSAHPLIHYVVHGWQARLQPHPLFDPHTYLEQRADIEIAGLDPLAHYLCHGSREGTSTHWLFDAEHYASGDGGDMEPREALLHYLTASSIGGRSPHALFDANFYRRQMVEPSPPAEAFTAPFLHFVETGLAAGLDPHPLFDTRFYLDRHPDVAGSGIPPFLHFIRYGLAEGRDPNPLFPINTYNARHPEAAHDRLGAVGHYLRTPAIHREQLSPSFDPILYLALDADAPTGGMPPLVHYLSRGPSRGWMATPLPLDAHAWVGPRPASAPAHSGNILMIAHDASHEDAALCALNAVRMLCADGDLGCHVILLNDGELAADFRSLAPTLTFDAKLALPQRLATIADVLHSFRRDAPDGVVIVNSVDPHQVTSLIGELGLKLLVWIHAMPVVIDSLLGGRTSMDLADRFATRLVTVSATSRDALAAHYELPPDRLDVLPNGVSWSANGRDRRQVSFALREELGLPPDALIVLGCGPMAFEKGTDLFIDVARNVIPRGLELFAPDNALRQAYFLWIGPVQDRLFAGLCRNDIQRLDLADRVRLLGQQEDSERFLLGADIFLMTAREEASGVAGLKAGLSGLPVISFAGCGDAAALGQLALTEVAYLDTDAMADAVIVAGNRPARRTAVPATQDSGVLSWAQWHKALRALLKRAFAVPARADPAGGELQSRFSGPNASGSSASRVLVRST